MAGVSHNAPCKALRVGWDDAYEFGAGQGGYWARRRDGLGGTMTADDPDVLRRPVSEDYAMKPPRSLPG